MSHTKGVVFVEIVGLREAMQGMDTPAVRKAGRQTLADLTKMGKTEISAGIRQYFNVKKQDLDPRLVVRMPTYSSMTGEIKVSGSPIPLVYFGAREVRAVRGGGFLVQNRRSGRRQQRASGPKGVSYEVEPGEVKTLPNAFMAYHHAFGRIEVFQRKGKARYPLRSFRSITIASMFEQARVLGPVEMRIQNEFDKRFMHHLRFFIEQGRK